MGCGQSQELSPAHNTCPDNNNKVTPNGYVTRGDSKQYPQGDSKQYPEGQTLKGDVSSGLHKSVPKSVVFDVPLDDECKVDIIRRHPPKRLERLEPMWRAPHMTADMLEEKLRHADEKRLQELELVKSVSKRTSRVQRDIVMARQFEEVQQRRNDLEEKLKCAEKNRESKLKSIEEKKQMREERAQRIRAKAQRLQEEGVDLGFEIEKDETFNADEDEGSWLNGDANTSDLTKHPVPGRNSSIVEEDWEMSGEKVQTTLSLGTEGIARRLEDSDDEDNFFA